MGASAAGKGDDYRKVVVSKYVKNFDSIKWKKSKEPTKNIKGIKKIYVY